MISISHSVMPLALIKQKKSLELLLFNEYLWGHNAWHAYLFHFKFYFIWHLLTFFFSWLCLLTLSFYKPTFMNWVFFAFKSVLAHKFLINLWVNWVFFAFKSVLAHKLLIHLWVNWVFFAFNGSLTPNDRQFFLWIVVDKDNCIQDHYYFVWITRELQKKVAILRSSLKAELPLRRWCMLFIKQWITEFFIIRY